MSASHHFASPTVTFADIAHGSIIFDRRNESEKLVLELIDTRWVQRLRQIRQTGNTNFVYMFSEHSRFGHSLGVAYLAKLLLDKLSAEHCEAISPLRSAVLAAALLHDVGHVAPGSHLAERLWSIGTPAHHEELTKRIIQHDPQLTEILVRYSPDLPQQICQILSADPAVPAWTHEIISGGGWNADRGNWAIIDSAMCAVTYGRYNIQALVDAFSLSPDAHLVIQESRLDALTHFFVARDSMYRQVYQHRVLQAADALSQNIIRRLRNLVSASDIFLDEIMSAVLNTKNYANDLPLSQVFEMTESWWQYHIARWCRSSDNILRDLAQRQRDRRLFKTIRIDETMTPQSGLSLLEYAQEEARKLGFDPNYYVTLIDSSDKHRQSREQSPLVRLDSGAIVPVTDVEPLIAAVLSNQTSFGRRWIAVPKEVKDAMNRTR